MVGIYDNDHVNIIYQKKKLAIINTKSLINVYTYHVALNWGVGWIGHNEAKDVFEFQKLKILTSKYILYKNNDWWHLQHFSLVIIYVSKTKSI